MRECASPKCSVKFTPKVHNQLYHSMQCKRDNENVSRRRPMTRTQKALEIETKILELSKPEVQDPDDVINHLRMMNQRLARENAKLKVEKYEFHEAFYQGVQEACQSLDLTATKKPTLFTHNQNKTAEEAIAVVSDWQLGKRTIDYGVEECEKRVELYMDKMLRITDIQRKDHDVNNLRAWVLGDMVEGEAIFPSQAHHIEASLYTQIMRTSEIIAKTIVRRALENFDKIHFVGIAGNHGAIGGKSRNEIHPETNADRLVYRTVQLILENEPRITWDIPAGSKEGDFYTIDQVGEKRYLLLHGHQIRGAGSMAAIEKRITNWAMSIKEDFDYVLMGHFHNPTRYTINNVTLYINGTTESSNGWSVEVMGKQSRPCQYLMYAHPKHGITAEYPVYLDYN